MAANEPKFGVYIYFSLLIGFALADIVYVGAVTVRLE
jgi:hypothetical protein